MSLLPHAYAQGISSVAQVQQTGKLIEAINSNIVGALGVLLLALTIIAFFAGVVRFIWALREGDIKAAENGKRFMLWSLLAVFVVFSIYGIIIFMQMTLLGKRSETTIGKPCLNFVSGCSTSAQTQTNSGGAPSSQTTQNGSEDDCLKNNRRAGQACTLPNGSNGVCTDIFGAVSCQAAAQIETKCSVKTAGEKCLINGVVGTCKIVGLDPECVPEGVSVTTDDQDCHAVGTTCQGLSNDGAVTNGVCKSNGAGGFYCDVPRSDAISSPCGGKSFGDSCDVGDGLNSGKCIRKDTTSSLYCSIMIESSGDGGTVYGSTILKEGDGCVYGAPTNKVCGVGLTCKYSLTTGGNKLYTCQK